MKALLQRAISLLSMHPLCSLPTALVCGEGFAFYPEYTMFDASICHIAPQHVAVVHSLSVFCGLAAVASLITGKTYFRRVIDKAFEPKTYWLLVVFFAFMAIGGWASLAWCPRY